MAQLSSRVQYLLAATAVAYVVVGLPLFFAPEWASEHFAWRVSPFVAMTAGGWCLGTAAFALVGTSYSSVHGHLASFAAVSATSVP